MAQNITNSPKGTAKVALSVNGAIGVEGALPLVGSDTHVVVDLRDGREEANSGIIPCAAGMEPPPVVNLSGGRTAWRKADGPLGDIK